MYNDEELMNKARDFLRDSSSHFKTQQVRMDQDLQRYSGNFWSEDLIKEWGRSDRPKEVFNLWKVFINAIASPFSLSPYHIELEDKSTKELDDLQKSINAFEHNSDTKNHIIEWLSNTAVVGQGVATVSIIDKSKDEQEIRLELIDDMSCVALDPAINTTSGSDAEMGAIVNWMSLVKAKRLYGEDVVSTSYPQILPPMCDIGDQWAAKANMIQVVNFYYKDTDGKVVFSQICGLKVIKHEKMPYTTIPIIRMTGYKVKDVKRANDYIGVVRATQSLQLGANIGYSTLMERMNRSPKGNFLMPVGAIEGLEKYYQIAGSRESLLYLYNGNIAPTPIKESFETGDLVNTISQCTTLMSNVLGIPITGINGLNLTDKTATEVLVQQTNSQSNVSCFYTSAYEAIRTLGRILIELYGFNADATDFSLQNGPDVITRNAKKRQELSLLVTLLPDNMKPIVAKYMADTLDDTMADSLAKDIVANMDPNTKLVSDTDMDPNAVHILNGMKNALDQSMQELSKTKVENEELKKQLDALNLQVLNMKGQQELDWKKFQVSEQNKVRLEEAKILAQGVQIDNKAKADADKTMLEGEKLALEADKISKDAAAKALDAINKEEQNAFIPYSAG
jgi:hypothetical protein